MAQPSFQAGAATSNITPSLGVSINGGMQDRTATHIHDELHARCLVLDDGQRRVALVVCDNCAIPGTLLSQAKHQAHSHTGIPLDQMLISATHTHEAPTVAAAFQSEPDPAYCKFLVGRIADGIRRAVQNLGPAEVGWGTGTLPGQVFNRRWRMRPGTRLVSPFGQEDRVQMNPPSASPDLVEPAGPTDPEVCLLALRRPGGRPLAVLANYSLHYVGDTGPGEISADYFGAFADRLAHLLAADYEDPPFVALMSNGTSGNINNINFRQSPRGLPAYTRIRLVADEAAQVARRVYAAIEFRPHASLAMREAALRLGRRSIAADELARARFILAQAKGPVLQSLEEIYARETVLLNDYPPVVDTLVQALRVGELGIAASPCETFVETGLAIKEASPLRPTFTISLANDYRGYLPTADHHALGGYETWRARSSYLEVDAEARIRTRLLELLAETARS
jgi:hypothetical protein